MTIALTLEQHLGRNDIAYDVLSHAPTTSSLRTVEASNVPADALAKTVVLKGDRGYLLAVLPASEQLEWKALESASMITLRWRRKTKSRGSSPTASSALCRPSVKHMELGP
jgi:prolyl-tRNA editing enzyme YbaK/EbsC (Cys-tRNA(Pro) deacylase)